jgi:hypothetical protein
MLHTETIESNTLELLNELMQKPYLQKFILFGGTSLALQIGHRPAMDLHLYCNEDFNTNEIKEQLINDFSSLHIDSERQNILISKINNIKVDFIRYKYNFDFPVIDKNNLRLANIKDIAPMKLDAISARGKKKDFFDLYFLLKKFTLPELLELYQKKYKHTSIFHVVKSISYFDDAEHNPDPIIFDKKITWEKVKLLIIKEIRKL